MLRGILLAGTMLGLGATPVLAQSTAPNTPGAPVETTLPERLPEQPVVTTPTPPQTDDGDTGAIADIVVTAQKRSENLQSTPLAITALTQEAIKDRGISSVADLTAMAPSVSITTAPASTTNAQLYIRGIGDFDTILTSDSPIGLYVDGIILGRAAGSAFDILDLERIEVLRGPQGTLYGRNTIGGALNLITAKPRDTFGVEQNVSAGSLGFLQWRTALDTGEIGDTGLSARFTYLHKQRDGYIDNVNARDNRDPGAYDVDAFRAALRLRRGALTIDYGFDYSNRQSISPASQFTAVRADVLAYINASPSLGGAAPLISTERLDTVRVSDQRITDRVMGHTLTAELDLGALTVRSLTGLRRWRNVNRYDDLGVSAGLVGFTVSPAILAPPYAFVPLGVQPISLFSARDRRRQNQFSQELNLLGKIGDRFDFVVGGYYFHEHSAEYNPQGFLIVIPSATPIPVTPTVSVNSFGVQLESLFDYDNYSTSKAAFAQGTFHFTDTLSVTGGVRYTKDDKRLEQRSPFLRTLRGEYDRFNYSAAIDWQAMPTLLVYARVASGYKAGGFNARAINGDGYQPENLTSYEAGVKSDLFDRRVRLNLTGYYADHGDLQVSQPQSGSGGATSVTVNAGAARYWGIEGELTVRPTRAITLGGNVGYTNRKYKQFIIRDPVSDQLIDASGFAKFPIGATTTVSAFADVTLAEMPVGNLAFHADYDYRGKIYYFPTNVGAPFLEDIAGDPRSLVNLRLALRDVKLNGATAEIALWGRNVLDEKYRIFGLDFGALGFGTNTYAEPATYGIDVRLTL